MECSRGQSKRSNTADEVIMVGTSKSSRTISKPNDSSCAAPSIQHSNKITPTIRIVHIFPPKVVKTDPANFRAIVQKLTGRHSRRSSKKSKEQLNRKSIFQASPADISQILINGEDLFCSKQARQKEIVWYQDQFETPLAEIRTEFVEHHRVKPCDKFSGYVGGFEELDVFPNLVDSGSILPEFTTINPPPELIDRDFGIFRPAETDGYSQFYQQLPFQNIFH